VIGVWCQGPRQGPQRVGPHQPRLLAGRGTDGHRAFLVAQYYVHDSRLFMPCSQVWCSPGGQSDHRAVHLDERGRSRRCAPPHGAATRSSRASPSASSRRCGHHRHRYRHRVAIGLGDGNIELTFYLVALIGIGLLATAGMVVSRTVSPVSTTRRHRRDVGGVHRRGRADHGQLDAVGNTTKASPRCGIGSAVIASVALFACSSRPSASRYPACTPRGQAVLDHSDQRGQSDHVHRAAHRRLHSVPLLLAGHPGRGTLGGTVVWRCGAVP